MSDHRKLWEKLKKLPGGDRNPFEVPLGPAESCLTPNQVVAYIKGERDSLVVQHLELCSYCNKRVKFMESYTKTD